MQTKGIWERTIDLNTEEEHNDMEDTEQENEQNFSFDETEENFGALFEYIVDDNITDIDWNGRRLWLTTAMNERICVKDIDIDATFFERFAQRIANINGEIFNRMNPVLEAETESLRTSFVHPVRAVSGLSCCIRKTPPMARIDAFSAITDKLCEEKLLHLLANCIKAHMNMVINGEPKAGKTEFGKFLSLYIPDSERVITIEDVSEWRYRDLKPEADCVQMRVDDKFTYSDAIKAALKQNPRWLCLTETRGNEVRDLIKCFSTGISGITTLHTDDVRKVPERMLNMVEDEIDSTHFINNVYEFVDIAVLVSIQVDKEGRRYRKITQVGLFGQEEGTHKNFCRVIYSEGHFIFDDLPTYAKKKFHEAGIRNPFFNEEIYQELKAKGYECKCTNTTWDDMSQGADNEDIPNVREELNRLAFGGGFSEQEEVME